MKIRNKLVGSMLAVTMGVSLTVCGSGFPVMAEEKTEAAEKTEEAEGFPFTLKTKDDAEVTFTHVPEKVLAVNANAGDQLMAMGLGDKIIGRAYTNSKINPEWNDEYEKIPNLGDAALSLETILDQEPDFVYGRSSAFSEKNNTTHDTLSQYGIMSLSSIEGYTLGADVDVVYEDFYNLGRIFDMEEKAEQIVNDMKEQIETVEKAVEGTDTVKAFVYDMAQEGGAYTCGDNFTAKLMEHAGGENIFKDMEETWANVSWEEVVERAPEVIVVNNYGDISLEQKMKELKENPALADVPAIKEDRIISVNLCEVFASSMTGDTIEKFAEAFHPECFK